MAYLFRFSKASLEGRLDEFKARLKVLGLPEDWEEEPNNVWMLRWDGFVLHFATTNGRYWMQGGRKGDSDLLLTYIRDRIEEHIVVADDDGEALIALGSPDAFKDALRAEHSPQHAQDVTCGSSL